MFTTTLPSPLGPLTLASDGAGLSAEEGRIYPGHPCVPGAGSAGIWPGGSVAGRVFFQSSPPGHAAPGPIRQSLPSGGVGAAAGDPLWRNHHLRRPGTGSAGPGHRCRTPGSGRRRGPQPHLHPDPLPPRGGRRRQPHRLCRRRGEEALFAGAGGSRPESFQKYNRVSR